MSDNHTQGYPTGKVNMRREGVNKLQTKTTNLRSVSGPPYPTKVKIPVEKLKVRLKQIKRGVIHHLSLRNNAVIHHLICLLTHHVFKRTGYPFNWVPV